MSVDFNSWRENKTTVMFFSYLRLSMQEETRENLESAFFFLQKEVGCFSYSFRICLLQYNKQEETGETVWVTRRILLEKE